MGLRQWQKGALAMTFKTIFVSTAAAILLCGCAEGYGVGYYGPAGDVVAYDGFYDDYYGPIYDGYWDSDAFYYRGRAGEGFHRDDGQHFRREASQGFHHIGGTAHVRREEDHRG
jgi:hypothetical protein